MTKTRDLADLGGGFIQAGTGAFLTEADLTSGTSDVAYFTLTYIWE